MEQWLVSARVSGRQCGHQSLTSMLGYGGKGTIFLTCPGTCPVLVGWNSRCWVLLCLWCLDNIGLGCSFLGHITQYPTNSPVHSEASILELNCSSFQGHECRIEDGAPFHINNVLDFIVPIYNFFSKKASLFNFLPGCFLLPLLSSADSLALLLYSTF